MGRMAQYLKNIKDRGRIYGWLEQDGQDGILKVDPNPNEPIQLSVQPTSCLSMVHWVLKRFSRLKKTTPSRNQQIPQDTTMLYYHIMNSSTNADKAKVRAWEDQYTVGDKMSGVLLLKVVIRESQLDTNATAMNIREKLSSLDTYLPTIGSDIEKFNLYVLNLVDVTLYSRRNNQRPFDESIQGLQAENTRACSPDTIGDMGVTRYSLKRDICFREYIAEKQTRCDGHDVLTPESIMHLATNKFK